MLLQHRYYDPGAGRFITLDPIRDGINWYAYCANDPINAVDPEGTHPWGNPHDHLGPPSASEDRDYCPRTAHQHWIQPLPGGYGHCDFKLIGENYCFYGKVISGDDRHYGGMCDFLPAKNVVWMEYCRGGPYIHWENWETDRHGTPTGPMVHYIFDVHDKHLKIFCAGDYRDPETKHKCYDGPAPDEPWPTHGPCPRH